MDITEFKQLLEDVKTDPLFIKEQTILKLTESIVERLDDLELSRSAFADKLGSSPAYVTKILRGNANFTLDTIVKLAVALESGIDISLTPWEVTGAAYVSDQWKSLTPASTDDTICANTQRDQDEHLPFAS